MLVKEIMTTDPIVAEVPGTREDVLRRFVQHSVSGMPVVKAKTKELAGVVTRSDVFRKAEEEQLALIMTSKPYTIRPEDPVTKAARLFFDKQIHGLPVIEGDNTLVGVLSPTDILRVLREPAGKTVSDFIKGKTAPVHEGTPLRVVWEIMRLTHSNALPVLNDEGLLTGIVADSDLFKLSQVDETIRRTELGMSDQDDDWATGDAVGNVMPLYFARSRVDLPKRPVRDIMVRDVITVFQRASATDAAKKMTKHRINQLPVVDSNDRMVGMLTDLDLMQAAF
ncbi:MAG TPA: CBS domain-containing protein [Candidatus Thermoplasmatota archaeon]|nr:CBS domain-containing protein [Candidatus Thermoplasmatota archaeon]